MAENDRQAQCQQGRGKGSFDPLHVQLVQLAAMPQHQLAEVVQLGQSETGRLGVIQNIGAMPVVIAVGNVGADFVQPRRPAQLAFAAFLQLGIKMWQLAIERQRRPLHACGLSRIS